MSGKRSYIKEAIILGDFLIDAGIVERDEIYWLFPDYKGNIKEETCLYNGNSGITYFLIELYSVTKIQKYCDVAFLACNRLMRYKYAEKDLSLSFYCGVGSVVYVIMKMYEVTNDNSYLNFCVDAIKKIDYKRNTYGSDLLGGTAGSVLTLLHFYNAIQERWVLDIIRNLVIELLNEIKIGKDGLYWDRMHNSIYPLCGFAHGTSGIAFVFFELFRYFGNYFFRDIAEMALKYEDQYFNAEIKDNDPNSKNNWPDFRKDIDTSDKIEENINAYLSGTLEQCYRPRYMSAWCHGAQGIGMVRFYAHQLTKKTKYLHYYIYSVSNITNSLIANNRFNPYALCHSKAGNGYMLLDSYGFSRNKKHYKYCIKICNEYRTSKLALNKSNNNAYHYDYSLLLGLAGIGHLFLRMANPHIDSILFPRIKNIKQQRQNIFDDIDLPTILYRKLFPNTSKVFIPAELNEKQKWDIEDIVSLTEKTIEGTSYNTKKAYEIDLVKIGLSSQGVSCMHKFLSDEVNKRRYNLIDFNTIHFYELELYLSPFVTIMVNNYRCYNEYILLSLTARGVMVNQFYISAFTFDILNTFNAKDTITNSMAFISNKYIQTLGAKSFETMYRNQIKECIAHNFLLL